ncbi:MAG: hypothetical protein M1836_001668 [Candelina mexicana]|nr:MAG: hypothetical protein M1836_001668 [Candelina mexicana]
MLNATRSDPGGHRITSEDHGAYVTITGALMMVWMILCFLMRIAIRLTINGPFKGDDFTISAATVIGIAQTIVTFAEVGAGYGKKEAILSPSSLVEIQKTSIKCHAYYDLASKSNYVGELLYLVAMCLSKLSTSLLVARLTRSAGHLTATRIVSGISIVWGVAAILTIAIRCKYSEPWLIVKNQCPDMAARWIAVGALGLVIEILLLGLPIYLVWDLQMPMISKVIVVFAFAFRLPVLVAGIIRLRYLVPTLNSSDYTFDSVYGLVCTQIELHYSLMAATIPCMKPFVKAFNTGYLGTAARQTNYGYGYGTGTFGNSDDKTNHGRSFALQSMRSRSADERKHVEPQHQKSTHNLKLKEKELRPDMADSTVYVEHNQVQEESGSVTSHGSDQMIIRRTVGWDIRYDDEEQQGQPQLPIMGQQQ